MRTLFNNDWYFAKTLPDREASDDSYKPVHIPHDWLIYQVKDLYESSFGHYRKTYDFGWISGRSIRLYFEGVYQDSTIYVNGQEAFDWKYGYSSFEADITRYLHDGENTIDVLVRHMAPNSRWYSGAGIFRDVWLIDSPTMHLVTDSVYFHTDCRGDEWDCRLSAEVIGAGADSTAVDFTIKNGSKILFSGKVNVTDGIKNTGADTKECPLSVGAVRCETSFTLRNVSKDDIWDIAAPHLLTLETTLLDGDKAVDVITQKTGIREIFYKPNEGFYLNGRHVKLHGVCLHHDLGCLGAAFNRAAAKRQLTSMMTMGVNAIRTSHNMPAVALMELCDELGLLVDSEAYDMWERPKTEFDYARFFDEWYQKDVASWIRRDRNHPSVIMWSVGNEIYDTHVAPRGCEVAKMLHEAVRVNDPYGNAPTTIGSNYMPWEGAQNSAREVDLVGYNYGESLYNEHHEKNPGWKIYGSETTSGVKSRGVYHFPRKAAFLTHEDLQCSSLGNCRAGVSAETAQKIIELDLDCKFCAGMFIWTGSDYIGESSPYSTKNAYFGCIDTAGLRKDIFYLYQAAWSDRAVLHVMPYWDYNEGQLIDVVIYTNLPTVELYVNGLIFGHKAPKQYTVTWNVPYQRGNIRVVGKAADGTILEEVKHSFGDSASLKLSCAQNSVRADGEDLAMVEISALDADGYPVENARDRVYIEVENGRLIGFDNGDSTDFDPYKSNSRKLFSGKAVAYIAPPVTSGKIIVRATAEGLTPAELIIDASPAISRTGISCTENVLLSDVTHEVPVRKIELSRTTGSLITPENNGCRIIAKILPANATYTDLKWSVVTDGGIETNVASVEVLPSAKTADSCSTAFCSSDDSSQIASLADEAVLTVHGDGSFRLRCTATNGKEQTEVLSEYEYTAQGFGQAYMNPYAFLPGCLYNDSISEMDEVSAGGVNIKSHNNLVGFTKTDFGLYGTDHFLIRVINWHKNDPFEFKLWLGRPGNSASTLLGTYTYQADFIWQTYQDNHYTLPYTLKGLQDLYFEFEKTDMRIDFGGFLFEPRLKAYEEIQAADCDLIHGDNYKLEDGKVTGIGNNVFMDFESMDFQKGTSEIVMTCRTRHDNDSVHVLFADETGIVCQDIVEVRYSEDYTVVTKKIPDIHGLKTVKFQFLPGCDFDFASFRICPMK